VGLPSLRFWLLLTFLPILLAGPARSQEEPTAPPAPEPTPEWQFIFAPYIWASGVEGSVEAHGYSSDVDVSFSDILNDLKIGALGALEARRGKLSLTSNVVYLKLSTDGSHPAGPGLGAFPPGSLNVQVDSQTVIAEGRAAWEVLSLPLFGKGDERRIALDLGPGFRYWWLDVGTDLKLKPGIPLGPFKASADENTNWVDFVGGARIRAQLSENIALVASGDYGGFGIGSSSHRTWSALGLLSYRLGEHWDLAAGWRTLAIDRGPANLRLQGPLLGVMYRF